MSFILNALRKSEQERQASQSGRLADRISSEPLSKKKKFSLWLVALVIANVILLIVFISSFYGQKDEDNSLKKPVVSKVATVTELDKTVIPQQSATDVSNDDQQMSIAEQIQKLKQKNRKPHQSKNPKPLLANKHNNKVKTEIKHNEKARKTLSTPVKHTKVKARTKTVQKPQKKTYEENNPPFLSELSYDYRRTVPNFRINAFVYSENEEERFVLINMKKYKTGQKIEEGIKLKEIRQDSVVINYKNRVFRIKR